MAMIWVNARVHMNWADTVPPGILFGANISVLACHNLNMNAMEKITVEDHLRSDW